MDRTNSIFIAFTGKPVKQAEVFIKIINGYECWDLYKLSFDEFIEKVKEKIPPVNDNVLNNYTIKKVTNDLFGVEEGVYDKRSWGLLIPDTLVEGGLSLAEPMFLLQLYSPNFLNPIFYINDMGIVQVDQSLTHNAYLKDQVSSYSLFYEKDFVLFYKTLFKQAQYGSWNLDRVVNWKEEDWRLFVASMLFIGLRDYETSKSSLFWQRESAEMVTILETLFTADKSQGTEVGYRLRKRIAVLLAWKFSSIESDIKELYSARSKYIHGSFFHQIARDSQSVDNNIPVPDFDLLKRQKEYVRYALVAYLNLTRVINKIDNRSTNTVINLIEEAIIDYAIRDKIIDETKRIFEFMPRSPIDQ